MEMEIKTITSDVLIIGSGGAGSRAAIEVDEAGLKPLIVSKGLSFRNIFRAKLVNKNNASNT